MSARRVALFPKRRSSAAPHPEIEVAVLGPVEIRGAARPFCRSSFAGAGCLSGVPSSRSPRAMSGRRRSGRTAASPHPRSTRRPRWPGEPSVDRQSGSEHLPRRGRRLRLADTVGYRRGAVRPGRRRLLTRPGGRMRWPWCVVGPSTGCTSPIGPSSTAPRPEVEIDGGRHRSARRPNTSWPSGAWRRGRLGDPPGSAGQSLRRTPLPGPALGHGDRWGTGRACGPTMEELLCLATDGAGRCTGTRCRHGGTSALPSSVHPETVALFS